MTVRVTQNNMNPVSRSGRDPSGIPTERPDRKPLPVTKEEPRPTKQPDHEPNRPETLENASKIQPQPATDSRPSPSPQHGKSDETPAERSNPKHRDASDE